MVETGAWLFALILYECPSSGASWIYFSSTPKTLIELLYIIKVRLRHRKANEIQILARDVSSSG